MATVQRGWLGVGGWLNRMDRRPGRPAGTDGGGQGPRLALESLTVGYGRRPSVLEDVSFQAPQGLTLLLGPNGVGKSTLIAALSQARPARRGQWQLRVDDHDLGAAEARLHTGLLPQSPAFPPRLSGRECVDYVAWLRRVPRRERGARVDEALATANATHVTDVRWSQMSYGTRQRVGIAAALVNKPSLVLLDEPLNGLDIAEKHSLVGVLASLPWSAVVLVSSHVVEGLEEIAASVVVLAHGRVAYTGPPADLARDHGSLERAYLALQVSWRCCRACGSSARHRWRWPSVAWSGSLLRTLMGAIVSTHSIWLLSRLPRPPSSWVPAQGRSRRSRRD